MNNSDSNRESLDARTLWRVGFGVVAGGLMFVGETPAQAAAVVSESFESSPSSIFGAFNSYAYSQAYTSINIPPGSGARYYTGASAPTTTTTAIVSLTGAVPISTIDAGLANFSIAAYFSTYLTQNDWTSVSVLFQNGTNGPLGSAFTIGGEAFVTALGTGPGTLVGGRDWEQDSESGIIPINSRFAQVTLFTTRKAGGAGDGYLDLVTLDVTAIPEPSTVAYSLLGVGALGGLLWSQRRNR